MTPRRRPPAARAVAAAVSVIVVIDAVVGLLVGVAWFGEHVVVTPLSLTAALAAAVAVVVGIVLGHAEPRPGPGTIWATARGPRLGRSPRRRRSGDAPARGTLVAAWRMNGASVTVGWSLAVALVVLVGIAVSVSLLGRFGISRALAAASVRAVLQLAVVATIIVALLVADGRLRAPDARRRLRDLSALQG